MQWHYAENGGQQGPVSTEQIKSLLQSGRITPQTLVWREGMSDWQPAAQIPELSSISPAGNPQSPYQAPATTPNTLHPTTDIPNYLWQSIAVTMLCCLPAGIVAIVYASKVDRLRLVGDQAGAEAASRAAKTWCWVSLGLGIIGLIFYLGSVGMA